MTKVMQARLDPDRKLPFTPDIEWYLHHKHTREKVAVQKDLKGCHRRFCLCWMCKIGPAGTRSCDIARQLFELCKDNNLVTPVWECPQFQDERE